MHGVFADMFGYLARDSRKFPQMACKLPTMWMDHRPVIFARRVTVTSRSQAWIQQKAEIQLSYVHAIISWPQQDSRFISSELHARLQQCA